jgi:hypothetical protein
LKITYLILVHFGIISLSQIALPYLVKFKSQKRFDMKCVLFPPRTDAIQKGLRDIVQAFDNQQLASSGVTGYVSGKGDEVLTSPTLEAQTNQRLNEIKEVKSAIESILSPHLSNHRLPQCHEPADSVNFPSSVSNYGFARRGSALPSPNNFKNAMS